MTDAAPTCYEVPYGPYVRNSLDIYEIEDGDPHPLWVWIHGGGFWAGDKRNEPKEYVERALAAGIAVASVNYRFSQQAPYPASFLDCARAIQFLRYHSDSMNIDPNRIVCGGSSAGGGMSLWLGFHEDLADPTSDDPISRESTQPNLLACMATQSSYDPNFIGKILNRNAAETGALRALFRVEPKDFQTPEAKKVFADASAINYVSADAPPALMFYDRKNIPVTEEMDASYAIHHPKFGEVLRDKMAEFDVECIVKTRDDYPECGDDEPLNDIFAREVVDFIKRHFGM